MILEMFGLAAGGWSSIMNLIVYLLMLALFVLGIVKCIMPVVGNTRLLKRAVKNIRAGSGAKRSWQDDHFLGKGTLFAHWTEYLNNLFFADGEYHNPSNVEDYINEETVIEGPGRSTFADAIPGILVSLGFLGTLIGIASGLAGFDMSDSAAVQSSIVTLIPGMRYAFTTSIVGVVLSVTFNLITRMVNGAAVHSIDRFYAAMSRHAGILSVDPMTQIAIYQQEQNAMIRTLTDEIAGRFTTEMKKAVAEATKPMTESFNNFVTVTTEEQMRFLDRVVARFVDRMDASLTGQFRKLGQVLEETARKQEQSQQLTEQSMQRLRNLAQDFDDLQKNMDTMLTKLDAYTHALSRADDDHADVVARMSAAVEAMDIVSRQQTVQIKNVSQLQREMAASLDEFRAANEAFMHRVHEACGMTADEMHSAAAELNGAGKALAQTQQELTGQINADLRDAFDSFEKYMAEFTRNIDQVAGTITESVRKLPGAVAETGDRFLDEVDQLTDTVHRANERMKQSTR